MKWLLIRCHYELSDGLALENGLFNLKRFLQRNKSLAPYQRQLYFNRIRWCNRLMGIRPGDKTAVQNYLDALKGQITQQDEIWFSTKAREKVRAW